jgi:4-alpha-glucanotransferase
MIDYSFLKNTRTASKWEKLGMRRRSGVAVPLFSVRSKKSIGIGEIPDIKMVVKWCEQTGNTIIQLLPLNDTGYDFAPYNSVSSYAIDPMYISIQLLRDVNLSPFKKDIRELRSRFSAACDKVDYAIKQGKVDLLWKIYKRTYLNGNRRYENFIKENSFWLKDYAYFRALKHMYTGLSWEEWPQEYKDKDETALSLFWEKNKNKIEFHYWMQWQLSEQLKSVKNYASEKNIFLMGDIPFLVSRDSADVWSEREIFNLELSSGAPPDMYFANGQRWGMPPYRREVIEKTNFDYFRKKLIYAENFYDMYRIDHFVGFFRLWTIDMDESEDTAGLKGMFDPPDEWNWEETGRKLLDAMRDGPEMLPCAEDLGTVPDCSGKVLWEYGIPGMDVQRWKKEADNCFLKADGYRWLSAATVSTHDSSSVVEWWHNEAGTVDGILFRRLCANKNIDEEKTDEIISYLFDPEHSYYDRLLWKNNIAEEIILQILNLPKENCYDIIALYNESFGEKEKFLDLLGITDTEEREMLLKGKTNLNFIRRNLRFISGTSSIFSIQLLQEWLCLDENFLRKVEEKSYRINFPGVVNDANWTMILPYNLEKILNLDINGEISGMVLKNERI